MVVRIVHAPMEIAGQIGILCDALQKLGHSSIGYNFFRTYLGFTENLIHTDMFEIMRFSATAMEYFDFFHFHYGMSFMSDYRDLEILSRMGKPMVMHHWGNDVRKKSIASIHNPYVNTDDSPQEEKINKKLSVIGQYISTAIVQDYEVVPYVQPYYKEVHILPLAIKLAYFPPVYPDVAQRVPLVVHAPTNPTFKGTEAIEKVISQLQKEIPFRYQRIEKLSHKEAVALYKAADIVIDQILCGSYGLLSVEAMALGKPVVTFIRDDLIARDPAGSPPVCNANPDTLYDILKTLLHSGDLRLHKGKEGRQFVEKVHDSYVVGEKLLEIYNRVLTGKK
jgi:glycosyltransferase involved in cell wall biosynthesis